MAADLRRFGELFAVGTRNGLTRPKAVRGAGVKMVNMGELFAYPRLRNAPMDRVPLSTLEVSRFLLEPGDLLFARQSLVLEGAGKCSIFLGDDELVTFESHITRVRLDPQKADPRFYFYYLQSHHGRAAVASIVEQGAGASGIRGSDLTRLGVSWRPVSEQRDIADRLGALDDKIEQNRRTAQALARLARALFKAWFVDFEPVKAKAAGATAFPSMPQQIFDALPMGFVNSAIGFVPEGWEVKALSSVCTLISGGTPKRSEADYWDGDVPWYSVKDAPDHGELWVIRTSERISVDGLTDSAARMIPKGSTIISARGTVGKLAMAGVPMAFNQSCYGLLPGDGKSFGHLNLLMQSVVADLQQRTHGSVFDTITRATFDGLLVTSPPAEVVSTFESVVDPSLALLLALVDESSNLAAMRDYLLPKLLNGEVQVEAAHG